MIPNSDWLISFGESSICLVSANTTENISLERVRKHLAKTNFFDYLMFDLIPLSDPISLYISGFKYGVLPQNRSVEQFIIEYDFNHSIPIFAESTIDFLTSTIDTTQVRSFFDFSQKMSLQILTLL